MVRKTVRKTISARSQLAVEGPDGKHLAPFILQPGRAHWSSRTSISACRRMAARIVRAQIRKMEWEAISQETQKQPILADFHNFHRVWKATKKSFVEHLTYFPAIVRLQMVRGFLKSAGPCRGFTVGSEVIQGTDPIVRRLISTG
jgi:hypothetical protein